MASRISREFEDYNHIMIGNRYMYGPTWSVMILSTESNLFGVSNNPVFLE